MKEVSGILILGRSDLNKVAKKKRTKNVEYTDIELSLEPFKKASIVLFVDDENYQLKILKSRYMVIS